MLTLALPDTAVDLWPLALVVLVVWLVVLWRRQAHPLYLISALIFGLYLLLALDKVFFPIRIIDNPSGSFWRALNLIPLNFNLTDLPHIAYLQIVLNILLTVPFGFGLNFLTRIPARAVFWLAVTVGVGIEAGQLAISLLLGYPYRIIDINDALLNALGVLIGYGLFHLLGRFYLALIAWLGIEPTGLIAYIQMVIDQTHLPDHSARDS